MVISHHDSRVSRRANRSTALALMAAAFAVLHTLPPPAHAMYDPHHGRWLQRDPVGVAPPRGTIVVGGQYADGSNLYRYAQSNPVSFTDPYGTTSEKACRTEVDQAMKQNTILSEILKELDKLRCKKPKIICCNCKDKKPPGCRLNDKGEKEVVNASGAFYCDENCMQICLEGKFDAWQFRCTLVHEYTHALQCCKRKQTTKPAGGEPSQERSCEEIACDELEAVERSGYCEPRRKGDPICGGPPPKVFEPLKQPPKEDCIVLEALASVRIHEKCKDKNYKWIIGVAPTCKKNNH